MRRDLTASVATEVDALEVMPVFFVKLEFDTATTFVWSGTTPIIWDGENWAGVGSLGNISPIQETSEIQANGVTIELSGVPSTSISLALTEEYQGRPATIWLGFMEKTYGADTNYYFVDSDGNYIVDGDGNQIISEVVPGLESDTIITNPIKLFAGRMDIMQIIEQGDTATISISLENRLVDLLKPRILRYTHEDQQTLFPGDLGFEFVTALQDKEVVWGPT